MSTTISKIFGWVLLAGGLILIIGTAYSSYNVFVGQSKAPEIFKISAPVAKSSTPASIEGLVQDQIKGLIPQDTIPKILNLVVWSMLAGVLLLAGGQISSLGIKLIKS